MRGIGVTISSVTLIHTHPSFMFKKLAVLGAVLAFSALAFPALSAASSLTSQQVSAILSLLQSFGANSSTIANVQAALTGQPSTGTASASCVSLTSDLYAGETDAQTNGQVSRLQSFLNVNPTGYFGPLTEQAVQNYQSSHGIVSSGSPDTTGYGFVGPQTRESMGCSPVPQPSNTSFTASPTSGAAPMTVTFTTSGAKAENGTVNFGDGNSEQLLNLLGNSTSNTKGYCGSAPDFFCSVSHTYASASTYTAALKDSSGDILATQTITVTGSNSAQPSATIDQSSLTTSSLTPTITGTAIGLTHVDVYIGQNMAARPVILGGGAVPVVNGRWSYSVPASDGLVYSGSYYVSVQNGNTGLAQGTLTFSSVSVVNASPTGSILSSSFGVGSLAYSTGKPVFLGSASNASTVTVSILNGSSYASVLSSGPIAVNNGAWTWYVPETLPNGSYIVQVYAGSTSIAADLFTVNATISSSDTPPTVISPNLQQGLVGHWTFDSSTISGNTVADVSGNGNNGTMMNGPTVIPGVEGQALSFNGTDQYVSVPNSSSLNPNVISVSFWVKSAVAAQNFYAAMVNKRLLGNTSPFNVWSFDTNPSGNTYDFCITNNAGSGPTYGQWCLSNGVLSTSWTHIVGTYDGTTQKLYENGVLVASQPVNITLASSTLPVAIGWDNSTGGVNQHFNGAIDDVRIYNRALSATEVNQLYDLGVSSQ